MNPDKQFNPGFVPSPPVLSVNIGSIGSKASVTLGNLTGSAGSLFYTQEQTAQASPERAQPKLKVQAKDITDDEVSSSEQETKKNITIVSSTVPGEKPLESSVLPNFVEKNLNQNEITEFPHGQFDFLDIHANRLHFVDKTDSIFDIIEKNKSKKIKLITRPSRFGKSLILSTLAYFLDFNKNRELNKDLIIDPFNSYRINNNKEYKYFSDTHRAKYTVIDLNFLQLIQNNNNNFLEYFYSLMQDTYKKFDYILDKLSQARKEIFLKFYKMEKSGKDNIQTSLRELCNCITEYNKNQNNSKIYSRPIIIIDEFDAPLLTASINGFFKEALELIQPFLLLAFKSTEQNYSFGILSGILRVSGSKLFSTLNSISIYSSMQKDVFSDYFGFTGDDVKNFLLERGINQEKYLELQEYYGNYFCGKKMLFNPWSIAHAIRGHDIIYENYWIGSQRDSFVKKILENNSNFSLSFIKPLLNNFSINIITEQVSCVHPRDEVKILRYEIYEQKKSLSKINFNVNYALLVDKKLNWYYCCRSLINEQEDSLEKISENRYKELFALLKEENLIFDLTDTRLFFLNRDIEFKNKFLNFLVLHKHIKRLDEKTWLLSLLYSTGFLTGIPFTKQEDGSLETELALMVPNREIYNFYIKEFNLNLTEYPYKKREEIIKTIDNVVFTQDKIVQVLGELKIKNDTETLILLRACIYLSHENIPIWLLEDFLDGKTASHFIAFMQTHFFIEERKLTTQFFSLKPIVHKQFSISLHWKKNDINKERKFITQITENILKKFIELDFRQLNKRQVEEIDRIYPHALHLATHCSLEDIFIFEIREIFYYIACCDLFVYSNFQTSISYFKKYKNICIYNHVVDPIKNFIINTFLGIGYHRLNILDKAESIFDKLTGQENHLLNYDENEIYFQNNSSNDQIVIDWRAYVYACAAKVKRDLAKSQASLDFFEKSIRFYERLNVFLDGYDLLLMSESDFKEEKKEKKKPILIEKADGSYKLWGNKDGKSKWEETELKNFEFPVDWQSKKSIYVSPTALAIWNTLKQGHIFLDKKWTLFFYDIKLDYFIEQIDQNQIIPISILKTLKEIENDILVYLTPKFGRLIRMFNQEPNEFEQENIKNKNEIFLIKGKNDREKKYEIKFKNQKGDIDSKFLFIENFFIKSQGEVCNNIEVIENITGHMMEENNNISFTVSRIQFKLSKLYTFFSTKDKKQYAKKFLEQSELVILHIFGRDCFESIGLLIHKLLLFPMYSNHEKIYEQAVYLCDNILKNRSHMLFSRLQLAMGKIYEHLGDPIEAKKYYEKGIENFYFFRYLELSDIQRTALPTITSGSHQIIKKLYKNKLIDCQHSNFHTVIDIEVLKRRMVSFIGYPNYFISEKIALQADKLEMGFYLYSKNNKSYCLVVHRNYELEPPLCLSNLPNSERTLLEIIIPQDSDSPIQTTFPDSLLSLIVSYCQYTPVVSLPTFALLENAIGETLKIQGFMKAAFLSYKSFYKISKAIYGDKHVQYFTALNNLGELYTAAFNFELAEKFLFTAWNGIKGFFGDYHIYTLTAHTNIVKCRFLQGKYNDLYNNIDILFENINKNREEGHDPLMVAEIMAIYGRMYIELNHHDLAIFLLEKSLEMIIVPECQAHPCYANIISDLILSYAYLGRFSKAIEKMKIAKIIFERNVWVRYPAYQVFLVNIMHILYLLECQNDVQLNEQHIKSITDLFSIHNTNENKIHFINNCIASFNNVSVKEEYQFIQNECNIFLMSMPENKKYELSSINKLYLYEKSNEEIFYIINVDNKKTEFTIDKKLFYGKLFNQKIDSLNKFDDIAICQNVLAITSSRNHTYQNNNNYFSVEIMRARCLLAKWYMLYKKIDMAKSVLERILDFLEIKKLNNHHFYAEVCYLLSQCYNTLHLKKLSKNNEIWLVRSQFYFERYCLATKLAYSDTVILLTKELKLQKLLGLVKIDQIEDFINRKIFLSHKMYSLDRVYIEDLGKCYKKIYEINQQTIENKKRILARLISIYYFLDEHEIVRNYLSEYKNLDEKILYLDAVFLAGIIFTDMQKLHCEMTVIINQLNDSEENKKYKSLIYQNLASFYHAEYQYKKFLNKPSKQNLLEISKKLFKESILLGESISAKCAYVNLLYYKEERDQLEEIIKLSKDDSFIKNLSDERVQIYSIVEKPIQVEALQDIIIIEKNIVVNQKVLLFYLFLSSYLNLYSKNIEIVNKEIIIGYFDFFKEIMNRINNKSYQYQSIEFLVTCYLILDISYKFYQNNFFIEDKKNINSLLYIVDFFKQHCLYIYKNLCTSSQYYKFEKLKNFIEKKDSSLHLRSLTAGNYTAEISDNSYKSLADASQHTKKIEISSSFNNDIIQTLRETYLTNFSWKFTVDADEVCLLLKTKYPWDTVIGFELLMEFKSKLNILLKKYQSQFGEYSFIQKSICLNNSKNIINTESGNDESKSQESNLNDIISPQENVQSLIINFSYSGIAKLFKIALDSAVSFVETERRYYSGYLDVCDQFIRLEDLYFRYFPNHEIFLDIKVLLAEIHIYLGQLDLAEQNYNSAFKLIEQPKFIDSFSCNKQILLLIRRGELSIRRLKYEDAEFYFDQAKKLYNNSLIQNDFEVFKLSISIYKNQLVFNKIKNYISLYEIYGNPEIYLEKLNKYQKKYPEHTCLLILVAASLANSYLHFGNSQYSLKFFIFLQNALSIFLFSKRIITFDTKSLLNPFIACVKVEKCLLNIIYIGAQIKPLIFKEMDSIHQSFFHFGWKNTPSYARCLANMVSIKHKVLFSEQERISLKNDTLAASINYNLLSEAKKIFSSFQHDHYIMDISLIKLLSGVELLLNSQNQSSYDKLKIILEELENMSIKGKFRQTLIFISQELCFYLARSTFHLGNYTKCIAFYEKFKNNLYENKENFLSDIIHWLDRSNLIGFIKRDHLEKLLNGFHNIVSNNHDITLVELQNNLTDKQKEMMLQVIEKTSLSLQETNNIAAQHEVLSILTLISYCVGNLQLAKKYFYLLNAIMHDSNESIFISPYFLVTFIPFHLLPRLNKMEVILDKYKVNNYLKQTWGIRTFYHILLIMYHMHYHQLTLLDADSAELEIILARSDKNFENYLSLVQEQSAYYISLTEYALLLFNRGHIDRVLFYIDKLNITFNPAVIDKVSNHINLIYLNYDYAQKVSLPPLLQYFLDYEDTLSINGAFLLAYLIGVCRSQLTQISHLAEMLKRLPKFDVLIDFLKKGLDKLPSFEHYILLIHLLVLSNQQEEARVYLKSRTFLECCKDIHGPNCNTLTLYQMLAKEPYLILTSVDKEDNLNSESSDLIRKDFSFEETYSLTSKTSSSMALEDLSINNILQSSSDKLESLKTDLRNIFQSNLFFSFSWEVQYFFEEKIIQIKLKNSDVSYLNQYLHANLLAEIAYHLRSVLKNHSIYCDINIDKHHLRLDVYRAEHFDTMRIISTIFSETTELSVLMNENKIRHNTSNLIVDLYQDIRLNDSPEKLAPIFRKKRLSQYSVDEFIDYTLTNAANASCCNALLTEVKDYPSHFYQSCLVKAYEGSLNHNDYLSQTLCGTHTISGLNVLHLAALAGHTRLVEILLQYHYFSSPNVSNQFGQTTIDFARFRGHYKLAIALEIASVHHHFLQFDSRHLPLSYELIKSNVRNLFFNLEKKFYGLSLFEVSSLDEWVIVHDMAYQFLKTLNKTKLSLDENDHVLIFECDGQNWRTLSKSYFYIFDQLDIDFGNQLDYFLKIKNDSNQQEYYAKILHTLVEKKLYEQKYPWLLIYYRVKNKKIYETLRRHPKIHNACGRIVISSEEMTPGKPFSDYADVKLNELLPIMEESFVFKKTNLSHHIHDFNKLIEFFYQDDQRQSTIFSGTSAPRYQLSRTMFRLLEQLFLQEKFSVGDLAKQYAELKDNPSFQNLQKRCQDYFNKDPSLLVNYKLFYISYQACLATQPGLQHLSSPLSILSLFLPNISLPLPFLNYYFLEQWQIQLEGSGILSQLQNYGIVYFIKEAAHWHLYPGFREFLLQSYPLDDKTMEKILICIHKYNKKLQLQCKMHQESTREYQIFQQHLQNLLTFIKNADYNSKLDTCILADLYQDVGDYLFHAAQYIEALQHYSSALQWQNERNGIFSELSFKIRFNKTQVYYRQGDYTRALKELSDLLCSADRFFRTENCQEIIECHLLQCLIYIRQSQFKKALDICNLNLSIRYNLVLMSNNILSKNIIEFKSTDRGLEYRVIGLDGNEKTAIIEWAQLPLWCPKEDKEILSKKDQLLPEILSITSQAGNTFVQSVDLKTQLQDTRASIYYYQGNYLAALKETKIVLSNFEHLYGKNHRYLLVCYARLSLIQQEHCLFEAAFGWIHQAEALVLSLFGSYHQERAYIYLVSGLLNQKKENYSLALSYLTRALMMGVHFLGKEHVHIANHYYHIGRLYSQLAQYKDSKIFFDRANTLYKNLLGADNLNLARVHAGLGQLYLTRCEFNQSHESLQAAKRIYDREIDLGEINREQSECLDYHKSWGDYYFKIGKFKQALEIYKKIILLLEKKSLDKIREYQYIFFCIQLVRTYHQLDKAINAEKKIQIIRQFVESRQHEKTSVIAEAYFLLAEVYIQQKNYSNAVLYLLKSYSIQTSIFSENHPILNNLYNILGSVYKKQHDFFKSKEQYKKILGCFLPYRESLDSVKSTYALGKIEYEQENYDEAIKYFKINIDMCNRLCRNLPIYSFYFSKVNYYLALVYAEKTEWNLASKYVHDSLSIYKIPFFEYLFFEYLVNCKLLLARILTGQKKYLNAIKFCRETLQLCISKKYPHNLMCEQGKPSTSITRPKGFYLYKINGEIGVLIIHSDEIQESIILSNFDKEDLLKNFKWPEKKTKIGYVKTQLSDELVELIVSNSKNAPEKIEIKIFQKAKIYIEIGNIYYQQQQFENAICEYKKADSLFVAHNSKNLSDSFLNLCLIIKIFILKSLYEQGKYQKAFEKIDSVLSLYKKMTDQSYSSTIHGIYKIAVELCEVFNKNEKGIELCKEALFYNKNSFDLLTGYDLFLMSKSDFEKEQKTNSNPILIDMGNGNYNLWGNKNGKGTWEETELKDFTFPNDWQSKKSIFVSPADASIWNTLKQGHTLLTQNKNEGELYSYMGDIYSSAEQYNEAANAYLEAWKNLDNKSEKEYILHLSKKIEKLIYFFSNEVSNKYIKKSSYSSKTYYNQLIEKIELLYNLRCNLYGKNHTTAIETKIQLEQTSLLRNQYFITSQLKENLKEKLDFSFLVKEKFFMKSTKEQWILFIRNEAIEVTHHSFLLDKIKELSNNEKLFILIELENKNFSILTIRKTDKYNHVIFVGTKEPISNMLISRINIALGADVNIETCLMDYHYANITVPFVCDIFIALKISDCAEIFWENLLKNFNKKPLLQLGQPSSFIQLLQQSELSSLLYSVDINNNSFFYRRKYVRSNFFYRRLVSIKSGPPITELFNQHYQIPHWSLFFNYSKDEDSSKISDIDVLELSRQIAYTRLCLLREYLVESVKHIQWIFNCKTDFIFRFHLEHFFYCVSNEKIPNDITEAINLISFCFNKLEILRNNNKNRHITLIFKEIEQLSWIENIIKNANIHLNSAQCTFLFLSNTLSLEAVSGIPFIYRYSFSSTTSDFEKIGDNRPCEKHINLELFTKNQQILLVKLALFTSNSLRNDEYITLIQKLSFNINYIEAEKRWEDLRKILIQNQWVEYDDIEEQYRRYHLVKVLRMCLLRSCINQASNLSDLYILPKIFLHASGLEKDHYRDVQYFLTTLIQLIKEAKCILEEDNFTYSGRLTLAYMFISQLHQVFTKDSKEIGNNKNQTSINKLSLQDELNKWLSALYRKKLNAALMIHDFVTINYLINEHFIQELFLDLKQIWAQIKMGYLNIQEKRKKIITKLENYYGYFNKKLDSINYLEFLLVHGIFDWYEADITSLKKNLIELDKTYSSCKNDVLLLKLLNSERLLLILRSYRLFIDILNKDNINYERQKNKFYFDGNRYYQELVLLDHPHIEYQRPEIYLEGALLASSAGRWDDYIIRLKKSEEAIKNQEIKKIEEIDFSMHSPVKAEILKQLSFEAYRQGNLTEAYDYSLKALKIVKNTFNQYQPNKISEFFNSLIQEDSLQGKVARWMKQQFEEQLSSSLFNFSSFVESEKKDFLLTIFSLAFKIYLKGLYGGKSPNVLHMQYDLGQLQKTIQIDCAKDQNSINISPLTIGKEQLSQPFFSLDSLKITKKEQEFFPKKNHTVSSVASGLSLYTNKTVSLKESINFSLPLNLSADSYDHQEIELPYIIESEKSTFKVTNSNGQRLMCILNSNSSKWEADYIIPNEVQSNVTDLDGDYSDSFINLLMKRFEQQVDHNILKVYSALHINQIDADLRVDLQQYEVSYIFIPILVIYETSEHNKRSNHWIALIIDKKNNCLFYLDPAKNPQPHNITAFHQALQWHKEIVLNPFDLQSTEKQAGWIRHCGAYSVELFQIFFETCIQERNEYILEKIEKNPTTLDNVTENRLIKAIENLSSKDIYEIRSLHIDRAYTTLILMEQQYTEATNKALVQIVDTNINKHPNNDSQNKQDDYQNFFIDLLMKQFKQSFEVSLRVYPAIAGDQINDSLILELKKQEENYAFVPIKIASNCWIALIVDKSHHYVLYFDPIQKTQPNEQLIGLQKFLEKNHSIILNPINFQQMITSKTGGIYSGACIMEMFTAFFDTCIMKDQYISGIDIADSQAHDSLSAIVVLNKIFSDSSKYIENIMKSHVKKYDEISKILNQQFNLQDTTTKIEENQNIRSDLSSVDLDNTRTQLTDHKTELVSQPNTQNLSVIAEDSITVNDSFKNFASAASDDASSNGSPIGGRTDRSTPHRSSSTMMSSNLQLSMLEKANKFYAEGKTAFKCNQIDNAMRFFQQAKDQYKCINISMIDDSNIKNLINNKVKKLSKEGKYSSGSLVPLLKK